MLLKLGMGTFYELLRKYFFKKKNFQYCQSREKWEESSYLYFCFKEMEVETLKVTLWRILSKEKY